MEGRRFVPQWVPQDVLFKVLEAEHNWIAFADDGDDGLPFPVAVSLGRAPDGRLIITGMLIANLDIPAVYNEDAPDWFRSKPVEITTRSLRKVHAADLLNSVTALRDDPKGRALYRRLFGLADDLPASFERRRPGPRGYSREHFEKVAQAYRRAMAEAPGGPIKTLAKQWNVPEATLRRWIQRARDMGLIGPSIPGKAGEQPASEVDRQGPGRDSSPPTPDPKEGRA